MLEHDLVGSENKHFVPDEGVEVEKRRRQQEAFEL